MIMANVSRDIGEKMRSSLTVGCRVTEQLDPRDVEGRVGSGDRVREKFGNNLNFRFPNLN